MEEQEDGWLTVLEKNGLGPVAAILDDYGITSETDLLVLDQDDFAKLDSRGLKPGRTVCFHLGTICQWYTSSNSGDKGSRYGCGSSLFIG